jgi:hypothetical protein
MSERGLQLMEGSSPALQKRLQEMRDVHAFWERELPLINQRWQQEQQKNLNTLTESQTAEASSS